MSYTAEKVQEAVSELEGDGFEDPKDYGYSNVFEFIKGEEESVDVPGIGKLEWVEDYGGEGQGDDYWVVFKTVETGQFWRVDGWYASHHGGELDGSVYEVEPKEVTVTQYEAKK